MAESQNQEDNKKRFIEELNSAEKYSNNKVSEVIKEKNTQSLFISSLHEFNEKNRVEENELFRPIEEDIDLQIN